MNNYILDENGEPVAEPDILKWGEWFKSADRHVAQTQVGPVLVSTVFLGIDHNFTFQGPPVLWETMVFGHFVQGSPLAEFQDRYTSRKAAMSGHEAIVRALRGELNQ